MIRACVCALVLTGCKLVPQPPPPDGGTFRCSATTCTTGCCRDNVCLGGRATSGCGFGGQQCQTCQTGATCVTPGTCVGVSQIPLPPIHDVSLLPVVQGAQRLLVESGNARIEVDPSAKDAITALGECADAVTYCYQPGTRDLAACLSQTKTCTTATPWDEAACCPQDCKDAFTAEVAAGATQLDAFEKVLFLVPDCFPGVRAALEIP